MFKIFSDGKTEYRIALNTEYLPNNIPNKFINDLVGIFICRINSVMIRLRFFMPNKFGNDSAGILIIIIILNLFG
jgi:hypothetical protein